jgi:hypothetical protein
MTLHVVGMKKTKHVWYNVFFLASKFVFFYVGQMTSRFFVKRLCAHTTCEEVRVNFSFEFFKHFKMCQILHSNNGSICILELGLWSRLVCKTSKNFLFNEMASWVSCPVFSIGTRLFFYVRNKIMDWRTKVLVFYLPRFCDHHVL